MSIVSAKFLIFITLTLILYYFCLPKWRWCVLLTASVGFFLANSSVALFAVFAATTLITWLAALGIARSKAEETKTLIVGEAIIAFLAVLFLYKESSFVVGNSNIIARITGLPIGMEMPKWVAPLGISYYTLILIGYLLDVRWGTIPEPQKNPLKMLLFAGYFPQMISGPFSRYSFMQEALFNGGSFQVSHLWNGLQRMIWGIFKVLVVSTRLSVFTAAIYEAQALPGNPLRGFAFVFGAILYVLTVYSNFSGSMDIVIGVSEMFGIPLAENFQRPFGATNLSEVWRRWHMTLGFWLKDYVLYPVLKSDWMAKIRTAIKKKFGSKAAKNIPTYIGMFVSWFCVGFWHGGSWKYICGSGLFFFVMILGGILLEPVFNKTIKALHINTASKIWHLFQRLRTFMLFALSVSFGRMGSLGDGLHIWGRAVLKPNFQGLFDFQAISAYLIQYTGADKSGTVAMLAIAFVGLLAIFFVSFLQEKYGNLRSLTGKKTFVLRTVAITVVLLACLWFGGFDNKVDFIYGNF